MQVNIRVGGGYAFLLLLAFVASVVLSLASCGEYPADAPETTETEEIDETCPEADPRICGLDGSTCFVCTEENDGDVVIVGQRYACGNLTSACPHGRQWVEVQNP